MAGRTKKEATRSLAQLKQYLRRDGDGTSMLAAVHSYVSELRATQGNLKLELGLVRDQLKHANARRCEMSREVAEAVDAVAHEKAVCQQLRGELAMAQARIAKMEDELGDNDSDVLPTRAADHADADVVTATLCNTATVSRCIKLLRRRLKKPPPCTTYIAAYRMAIFDPATIVREHSDSSYARLGLFVMVACMLDLPLCFQFQYYPWSKEKPCPIALHDKFMDWAQVGFKHITDGLTDKDAIHLDELLRGAPEVKLDLLMDKKLGKDLGRRYR